MVISPAELRWSDNEIKCSMCLKRWSRYVHLCQKGHSSHFQVAGGVGGVCEDCHEFLKHTTFPGQVLVPLCGVNCCGWNFYDLVERTFIVLEMNEFDNNHNSTSEDVINLIRETMSAPEQHHFLGVSHLKRCTMVWLRVYNTTTTILLRC